MAIKSELEVLLGVLAKRAKERSASLTKIRLVKFLYLLDLFWAQEHKGATYTKWKWEFVHYGPYCRASTDCIDGAEKADYLSAKAYESKYRDEDFRLYGPGSRIDDDVENDVRRSLPIYVSGRLFAELDRWCDDTFGLLDFVYFKTGPMRNALPGEVLSFDQERPIDRTAFRPIALKPLSNTKKAKIRDLVRKIVVAEEANKPEPPDPRIFDKAYLEMSQMLDGEETPVGIVGEAELALEQKADD